MESARNRRLVASTLTIVASAVLVALILIFERVSPPPPPPPPPPDVLAPMRPLRLADAALPTAAEIVGQAEDVASLIADRHVPMLGAGVDALVLGWGEALIAAERDVPRVPQRVSARDLLRHQIMAGAAVLVVGRLDDNIEAPVAGREEPRRWLQVGLDEGQFAAVLADADAVKLPIGSDVQIVGRFLGTCSLPGEGGAQSVPVVLARAATQAGDRLVLDPMIMPGMDFGEFRTGQLVIPDDLYDDISDVQPILETRPYYFTLGEVKLDQSLNGYEGLGDGNADADRIHLDPPSFRGKPFRVEGRVVMAWEDQQVARDRPFEVGRVARILMYHRDRGYVNENGKPRMQAVLFLYELAAITNSPLPAIGSRIAATGRFFKFRAIPVPADHERDRRNGVWRASDHDFAMLFITGDYTLLPPEEPGFDSAPGRWLFVGMVVAITGAVLFFVNRDGPAPATRRSRRVPPTS